MALTDWYWNRWIRRQGCKLGSRLSKFHKKAVLTLEDDVRMGSVNVASHNLAIGAHTYIRGDSQLQFVGSIGRYCSIGNGVVLGQEKRNHPTDWLSTHPFQYTDTAWEYDAPIEMATVGHDVWIGHEALILEGVHIGTGAVVATRALVTQNVPPYAVVAGVPAKVIRYRYPEDMIERLLASRWWERDHEALKGLPLNDPAACLDQLDGLPMATYRRMELTRKGGRLLG